jgi:hypothetical protein
VKIPWMSAARFGMLGLLMVGCAVGGWTVKGWKDKADAAHVSQVALDAAAKQALALNALNEANAKRMAKLATTLEGQAHAFAQLDAYLATHPMGSCRFDPATDRLWDDAYRAGLGADPAARRDGQAGQAGPATGQHEPAPAASAGGHGVPAVPRHD